MKILKLNLNSNFENKKPAILAMGMFDGLHLGHMALINEAVKLSDRFADQARFGSAILTFDIPPKKIFSQSQFSGKILSDNAKFNLIEQAGIDFVYLMSFTQEIFSMTPDEFFNKIILEKIDPKCIIVGFNYTFGKGKSGNVEVLRKLCQANDIDLNVVAPICLDGEIVSTTNVKVAILSEDINKVKTLLGRDYEIEAEFLDKNNPIQLQVSKDLILLPEGIYTVDIDDIIFICTIEKDNIIQLNKAIDFNEDSIVKLKFV